MNRRHLAAVLVLLALPIAACDGDLADDPFPVRSPVGRPTSSDSLVIGLVGTLSGPDSWRGEDAFEGADLAVHELNLERPEGAMPIELIALDDEGDPDKATARIAEIVGLERSIGLIYAGPPGALAASEPVLAARGIAAISIFGDLYGREVLSEHTFQAAPSRIWEARRLAAYLARDRGYRKIGIVAANDDKGRVATEALRASVPSRTSFLPELAHAGKRYEMSDMVLLSDPGIAAVPVAECGEPLIDVRATDALRLDLRLADAVGAYAKLRASVVDRLVTAQTLLPRDLKFLIIEGYRPLALQTQYFRAHVEQLRSASPGTDDAELRRRASRYISPPEVAPHVAGAAVDLTLCTVDGVELWMGTKVNDTDSDLCHTESADVPMEVRRNRDVMGYALSAAGFTNYPSEWWHWSYGDRYWAYLTGKANARYGPVDT